MKTKIQKWGKGLAVRIPKSFVKALQLTSGTVVNLSVVDARLVADPLLPRKYSLSQLLKKVSKRNLHPAIDTGPAVGKEVW